MSHCGKMTHEFPPGSNEARTRGCHCPVLDNEFGAGYMGVEGTYVTSDRCKLHWDAEPAPSVRDCAGCGGASDNVEDVSLLVGSGADEPRRLVWERPLCKTCLKMLLSLLIEERYPLGRDKTHGEL